MGLSTSTLINNFESNADAFKYYGSPAFCLIANKNFFQRNFDASKPKEECSNYDKVIAQILPKELKFDTYQISF